MFIMDSENEAMTTLKEGKMGAPTRGDIGWLRDNLRYLRSHKPASGAQAQIIADILERLVDIVECLSSKR